MDFVILAGGNSSRMQSSTPKIFQKIADFPCISYIINCCYSVDPDANVIVVTREEFAEHEIFNNVKIAIQKHPCGTADALKQAIPFLKSSNVIVMCGDMPLIQPRYLAELSRSQTTIGIIAMRLPTNMLHMPYGRIINNKIVEYKNATDDERKCATANTGVYNFKSDFVQNAIYNIVPNEITNEYYLTDILNYAHNDIDIIVTADYQAFHGINTPQDLALAEGIIQQRLCDQHMNNGVKIIDPKSVFFSYQTQIEQDVVIEPNVVMKGNILIKTGAIIKAFSYLEDCIIGPNVKIGPFARIRNNAIIAEKAEIGNFVEIKKSHIGTKSKVKHLAYIGDTSMGELVNIGAGTITCNYDGVNKHKTQIGDSVMVGANCSLIAPVNIGNEAIIGAGSTINKNIDGNALAIARAKQENKTNGAKKIRNKLKK